MATHGNPKPEELKTAAQLRKSLREFATATTAIANRNELTTRQYDLCLLIESSEAVIARQIAEVLHLTPNAASELITRAENDGLVARTSSARDARRVRSHSSGAQAVRAPCVAVRR